MKKLIFVCTLLGVSHFGLDTTYGMDDPIEHNVEPYNIIVNDVDTSSDDDSTDNLDPYATMYRNTTGRLTEEEICAFVNAFLCTLGSVLIMSGRLLFIDSSDNENAENSINSAGNSILIFTGIGIVANAALRCLRPNMNSYDRLHRCLITYLLTATVYALWSENLNAWTSGNSIDNIGLFISAQNMYGLAALGGFFLCEALYCR